MGKNQSASNLTNIIKQDASGNITFVSGSTTLMSVSSSGAITTTGVISGSNALSASYALNATSASYAATSSYASAFNVAGTLTATTLVVQTITSSVDFVTGSTRFGSILENTHVFSGSVTMNPGGLFVSSSGQVGIGTITPAYTLDVSGTGRFTGNLISSTNILIGTTTVGDKLTVVNSGSFAAMQIGNGTNSSFFGYANASGNYNNGALSGDAIIRGFSGVSISGTNGASTNLYINSSGNVGIGTSSPAYKFELAGSLGNFQLPSSGAEMFFTRNENNDILATGGSSSGIRLGAQSQVRIGVGPNYETRLTVTSGGNVGIGNTGESFIKLRITGISNTSSDYSISCVSANGTDTMWVRNDGAGYLKASAWAYGSDRRIKENINYIQTGLDKILALKPATFDYIDGVKNNIGWIAQDVQEVIPEAVNTISDINDQLTLKSDYIVPYLVKAIQEMNTKLDEQNQTIQNLQEQINILAK